MLPDNINKEIISDSLKCALKSNRFSGKQIIIFGCTIYAYDIIEILENEDVKIDCFIDNNESKCGSLCSGLLVRKPIYLQEVPREKILVIIASVQYCHEMQKQLFSMGLSLDNILLINVKHLIEISDSKECFDNRAWMVKKGIEKYYSIVTYENETVFICPYSGTGDIYLACGFLNEYMTKNKIEKYTICVTKQNGIEVVKLFGFHKVKFISEDECGWMLAVWQLMGSEKIHIKPLLFWGWHCKAYLKNYRLKSTISFIDYFKYDVFGLDKSVTFSFPAENNSNTYVNTWFLDNKLVKGKTIIIAPYAGSFISSIKTYVWDLIVEYLIEKGYCVCTVCYGKEKPIKNTLPIQFPYSEAIHILESSGGFIAVRSGLCDIVSHADCKMTVIYENGYWAADYERFSLKKMGFSEKVNEIIYEFEDEFINRIKEIY